MTNKIIIKKQNEVFNKIYSEPSIEQEIQDQFTFKVPGYQFSPLYKAKKWKGDIKLFNRLTHQLYGGLTKKLIKFCEEKNYEYEIDYDLSAEELSVVEATNLISSFNIPSKFQIRDYQLEAFIYALRNKKCLFVCPTGSGKSIIIYLLLKSLQDQKILILVPTTNLVDQLFSDFNEYGLDSEKYIHKIYSGQEKQTNKNIIISTWQSMMKQNDEYFKQFNVIIGDEAHGYKADVVKGIIEKTTNAFYRIGLTGTLSGLQTHELVLTGIFGQIKRISSTDELIQQKYLSPLLIKCIVLGYSNEYKNLLRDYQDEKQFLISYVPRNNFIKNLALSLDGNTLLLFEYINHGKALYDLISLQKKDVYFVYGGTDIENREQIRKIIDTNKNSIIIASFGVYSQGINIPNIHNIIFSSPSKSRIRVLQSIGRGLRKKEGKNQCVLFDISDDLSYDKIKNITLKHFKERLKIYNSEKFNYKIYLVKIGDPKK